jgi:hypothetical protein
MLESYENWTANTWGPLAEHSASVSISTSRTGLNAEVVLPLQGVDD